MRSSSTTPIAPFDPHVCDARQVPARLEPLRQRGRKTARDLREPRLALEQVERGVGGGAGQRIGHVGRPVHQRRAGSSDQKASNTLRAATVAASGRVPPVSALDRVTMSGIDAGLLAGEQRAGAAEAGEDLVEDQQQRRTGPPAARSRRSTAASWNSMPPAPCTSGSTMMPAISSRVPRQHGSSAAALASSVGRSTMTCCGQHPGEQRVHALFRIADRHGAGGVAVIAAAERHEPRAAAARRG